MSEVTANLTDAHADAVTVHADEVKPGDYVFDSFGGRHEVRKVTNTGLAVRIKRVDGWMSHHEPRGTITIVRGTPD